MDKQVALRNGSGIMMLITLLLGAGFAIWDKREQLKEFINKILRKEKTDEGNYHEAVYALIKQRIEEEKKK